MTRSGQHRWSTISSLSADSGVVGLSDEREEEDSEPRRCRRSRGADVERVDSGIGPGLSRTWKRPSASVRAWEAQRPCPDCGVKDGISKDRGERMCERCSKLRTERKEAILEFLNTESSYGEDLRIIKEEFYCPMQSAGLLTADQLAVVFANVQELIDVNDRFTEHLQDSIDQAFDQVGPTVAAFAQSLRVMVTSIACWLIPFCCGLTSGRRRPPDGVHRRDLSGVCQHAACVPDLLPAAVHLRQHAQHPGEGEGAAQVQLT